MTFVTSSASLLAPPLLVAIIFPYRILARPSARLSVSSLHLRTPDIRFFKPQHQFRPLARVGSWQSRL